MIVEVCPCRHLEEQVSAVFYIRVGHDPGDVDYSFASQPYNKICMSQLSNFGDYGQHQPWSSCLQSYGAGDSVAGLFCGYLWLLHFTSMSLHGFYTDSMPLTWRNMSFRPVFANQPTQAPVYVSHSWVIPDCRVQQSQGNLSVNPRDLHGFHEVSSPG